jgi:ribokinase
MLIAVIGDCLLDISVRPSGPMRTGADAPAAIRLSPGGQGANVAVWLARRGASVRLIAPMADDTTGRLLRDALADEGVELVPLQAAASGIVIALLDVAGERTMLSDRVPLVVDGLSDLLTDASWVHASGYALRDAAGAAVARALADLSDDVRLSVGGGSLPGGGEAVTFGGLLDIARPDLLILNRDESDALGPQSSVLTVMTDGANGSMACGPDVAPLHVPATAIDAPVVDATGAGDAYAAVLIGDLAQLGHWPPAGSELRHAMESGGRLAASVIGVDGAQGRVG